MYYTVCSMYYTVYIMSNTVCIRHSMYTLSHFAPSEDGLDIYADILMIKVIQSRLRASESPTPDRQSLWLLLP